jgi:AcrR family transcriptional regulator
MSEHPESTPAPSRKERDKLLREKDFLNAAEHLFSVKGYADTSMEDVAKEAEYATGTIYRYFESKEALYHQLLLRKGEIYFQAVAEMLALPASPREQIERVTREKINFFYANHEFMRIYMSEVARPQHGKRCGPPDELKSQFEAYQERLRGILRLGMAEKQLLQRDVDLSLTAWTGVTNEILSSNFERETPLSKQEIETFLLDFLQDGLFT